MTSVTRSFSLSPFRPHEGAFLQAMGSSAIHVRYMEELTKDTIREIEQIHSNWIELEVAGQGQNLIALCADDIELWPPDARPLFGRAAVSAQMAHGTARIHCMEITDRRIRGSNEIAYLSANTKPRFPRRKTPLLDKPSEAICGYCEREPVRGLVLS